MPWELRKKPQASTDHNTSEPQLRENISQNNQLEGGYFLSSYHGVTLKTLLTVGLGPQWSCQSVKSDSHPNGYGGGLHCIHLEEEEVVWHRPPTVCCIVGLLIKWSTDGGNRYSGGGGHLTTRLVVN